MRRCPLCLALVTAAAAAAVSVVSVPFARAGDLAPPPGPVAPTMKDLPDVEPRTVLRNDFDTLTPIVINNSGSYYLGEDIFAFFGQHGIQITADNVMLDLNGFSITGNTEVGSLDGVHIDPGVDNVTIVNGTIQFFFGDGVEGSVCTNLRVERVRLLSNGGHGLDAGNRATVLHCVSADNSGDGFDILQYSLVSGCIAADNAGDGIKVASNNHVTDNICRGNDGSGIHIIQGSNSVVGNAVSGNAMHGVHCCCFNRANRIDSNNATFNTMNGFRIEGSDNVVTRNSAVGNSGGQYDIDLPNLAGDVTVNASGAGAWDNFSG
jgi:hypothetical protein